MQFSCNGVHLGALKFSACPGSYHFKPGNECYEIELRAGSVYNGQ
jgi:hypothetical protein